jgi:hypothetical protein
MHILAVLLLVPSPLEQPGPLDAYHANYSVTKVGCEFTYLGGQLDQGAFDESKVWQNKGLNIIEDLRKHVDGRWSCDGSAESVLNSPDRATADGQLKALKGAGKSSGFVQFEPRIELLTDHNRVAYTNMRGNAIYFEYAHGTPQLGLGKTPHFRWAGEDLSSMLHQEYPDIVPARTQIVKGGRLLQVEVYCKDTKNGWSQTEIGYDSTVGYLPRFCRDFVFSTASNSTRVLEKYLVDVKNCKAGGFVPVEWYDFVLQVRASDINDPGYSPCMSLTPSKVLHAGHFKVFKFADRTSPAALEDLGRTRTIAAGSDNVVHRKSFPPKLTLDQIEEILKRESGAGHSSIGKFKPAGAAARDHIDRQELNEGIVEPRSYWTLTLLMSTIGIICAAWVAVRRKWRIAAVCAPILVAAIGCRQAEPPMLKLQGRLKDTQVIRDPREKRFTSSLQIANIGNCPARIVSIDGGCSCREVDLSSLPRTLSPGDEFTVRVDMTLNLQYSAQPFMFSIQTDGGTLSLPATLLAIPRSCLEPRSVANNSLTESESWAFEICHREVALEGGLTSGNRIVFPDEFKASQVSEEMTRLDAAPGVLFRERKYQLTLKSMSLGEFRSLIRIVDTENGTVVETPVVWGRLPFISSAPTRVAIAKHPVRVFLRCRDEAVELSRVVSCPDGIKAVISSPRELTVMLGENPPTVINGTIEVATTATDRSPLRVPVVRYAPLAQLRAP